MKFLEKQRSGLVPPPADVAADLGRLVSSPLPGQPAFFIFSIMRSGSTMLNNAFRSLCKDARIPNTNFSRYFFKKGLKYVTWGSYDLREFYVDGYCHRGFRQLPKVLRRHPLLKSRKSVLLVRDIRDAATSQYFSRKYAHSVPGGGRGERAEAHLEGRARLEKVSVDEHVVHGARHIMHTWQMYMKHLPIDKGLAKIYRYEDHIFRKKEFFREALDHLEIELPEKAIDRAVARVDIVPEREQVSKHVRVVKPGNHREKLRPETIEKLNEEFHEYLTALNYV